MFSTALISITLLAGVLGAPTPDQLPRNYNPPQPQSQYSQPQAQFVPQPQPAYRPQPAPQYQDVPAKYDFNWAVADAASANDFGQTETRDGANTQGSYYVLLPDGRRQTVTYYVNGDSGFVADVKYEGEARYPEPQQQQYRPQPQQSYQPQPQPQPRPQQTYPRY